MLNLITRSAKGIPLSHEEMDTNWAMLNAGLDTKPSLTGAGASGTWGISISGSAAALSGVNTIDHGGTGAITAADALVALGAYPAANPTGFITLAQVPVKTVAGRAGDGVGNVNLNSGDISGLANSATTDTTNASNISTGTLATARLPAITGDVIMSAGTGIAVLADTAVTPSIYGDATRAPTFTVDSKGRLVAAGVVIITPAWSNVTNTPTTLAGYGITDAVSSSGNATTASKLATARDISITGDATGSTSFDGSANVSINAVLSNVIVGGSVGAGAAIPVITYNSKGQVTSVTTVANTPAFSDVTGKPTTVSGYGITNAVTTDKLGAVNGVATLDATGKLTTSQIPDSLVGALVYQGTWNATTNTPTRTSGSGTKGHYYKVATAGTTLIDGNNVWNPGDHIIFNGTTWDRLEGDSTEVTTVAGRVGAVVLTSADIGGLAASATTDTTNAANISSGTLLAARMPAHTGDVTSTAGSAALTLSVSGVTAGVYGSTTQIPTFTVDAKGRITLASNVTISPTWANITGKPTTINGYGITDALALGSSNGAALGSAAPGVATTAARSDHAHPIPTIDALESVTIIGKAANDTLRWNGTVWVNVPETGLNAGTSVKLATSRTISTNGDATGSASFDGSANAAIGLTLAASGVTAGTYNNNAGGVQPFTVDAKGRLTSIGAVVTITPAWGNITGKPTTVSGFGITDAVTTAQRGVANGVATLDASGKLTTAQIPTSLVGAIVYQGVWNASTNSPALVSATGTKGFYYKVSVAGATSIDGQNYWQIGDLIIFDGSNWDRVEGGGTEVTTVAGRVGAIVLTASDIGGLAASATTDTTNAGNISSGTLLAARMPAHTGDVTSTAGSVALTLANTAVGAGAYGSATQVATFTVDAKGRLTAAGNVTVTPAFSSITGICNISQGGHGATTIAQARINLGVAASGANADITSLQAGVTAPGLLGSVNAGVTAAGNTQGTATALTADVSVVTSSTAGTAIGVKAVAAVGGKTSIVINRSPNAINVYPITGHQFDGLGANIPISLPVNGFLEMIGSSSTQWNTTLQAIVNAAFLQGTVAIANGGTGATTGPAALTALGGVSLGGHNVFTGAQSYTGTNKGTVASGTVTFDRSVTNYQKLTVGGALTIALTGWAATGIYSDAILELVNGGSAAITFPSIKWILPTTGAAAASFSAYLTAIGRTPAALQTAGTDFLYLWTTDGGTTINGKLV